MSQTEVAADTLSLLESFRVAIEANKGIPADAGERVLDAEGLAVKCFFHASSSLYLSRGTTISELDANFFDLASMNVLARATIEAFLVFDYVFVRPATDDEREFRHQSWILADLMERQELPATLPDSKKQQQAEAEQIENIKTRLRANPEFPKLTTKQQTQLLEKKTWRWESWPNIARTAGFSELHAVAAYRLLCSYAHSGSLSVLQTRQAKSKEDQQFLATSALRLINVALSFMIDRYCATFQNSKAALARNPQLAGKVQEWLQLGSSA